MFWRQLKTTGMLIVIMKVIGVLQFTQSVYTIYKGTHETREQQ